MNAWLHFARGPLFWTALAFMALGLVRHLGLTLWETARVYRRAGDKDIPVRRSSGIPVGGSSRFAISGSAGRTA